MLTFLKVAYVFFLARMAQWYCVGLESLLSLRKKEPSGEPFLLEKKKTLGKRRTRELEEKTIMEKTTREIKCGEEATISF